ncbi:MAG TPA: acyl carrier protein [Rhizomicrobium sp.]|jgi:acyl carrier protein
MTRSEILQKITEILSDVLDEPDLKLTEASVSDDVPDWDSINHVKLIIGLENDLKIRFEPEEITGLATVGDLIDLIQKKL